MPTRHRPARRAPDPTVTKSASTSSWVRTTWGISPTWAPTDTSTVATTPGEHDRAGTDGARRRRSPPRGGPAWRSARGRGRGGARCRASTCSSPGCPCRRPPGPGGRSPTVEDGPEHPGCRPPWCPHRPGSSSSTPTQIPAGAAVAILVGGVGGPHDLDGLAAEPAGTDHDAAAPRPRSRAVLLDGAADDGLDRAAGLVPRQRAHAGGGRRRSGRDRRPSGGRPGGTRASARSCGVAGA